MVKRWRRRCTRTLCSTIDSRPAGLEVIGTNEEEIRVTCTGKDVVSVGQVRIKLSGSQDYRKLTINGSTFGDNNLKIRIEVVGKTSLRVRMAAGQVTLNEIVGDKDIDLEAARQISISSALSGMTASSTCRQVLAR